MGIIDSNKAIKVLKQKGFRKSDTNADDHLWLEFWTSDDKLTRIKTKFSLGAKSRDIDDSLSSMIARQLHLSKSDFIDLVKCPLTQGGYENILREKGFV